MAEQPVTFKERRSRKAVSVGCFSLLLLGGALSVTAFFLLTAVPPPDPDTRVLPNPNGYDAVKAVVQTLTPSTANSAVIDKAASAASLRAALAPDLGAIGKLHQAIELPYMSPPNGLSMVDYSAATIPFNAQIREGARKCVGMSRLAKAEGRYGAAMDAAMDAVALGVKTPRGGMILDVLVGNACVAMGGNEALSLIEGLNSAELIASRGRVEELMLQRVGEAEVLTEERQFNLRDARVRRFDPASRMMYRQIDQVFREAIKECAKPSVQRQSPSNANSSFGRLVSKTLPDLRRSLEKRDRLLATLQVKLAVEEYRKTHRQLPRSLEELVPRYLTELPLDPPTQQPLKYRRLGRAYEISPP